MMCRWYVKPLLSVMPGKTTLTTLSFLMSLLSFGLQAQSSEPHDSVQQAGGDKTDDDSSLDLFDQDTELTKKGWLQFYAEVGFMRLEAAGSFSLRLPIGKQVTIIDFDRAGLDDNDNSYWVSLNWRSANSRCSCNAGRPSMRKTAGSTNGIRTASVVIRPRTI